MTWFPIDLTFNNAGLIVRLWVDTGREQAKAKQGANALSAKMAATEATANSGKIGTARLACCVQQGR